MSAARTTLFSPAVSSTASRPWRAWAIGWCLLGVGLIASPGLRLTADVRSASPSRDSTAPFPSKRARTSGAPGRTKSIENVRVGDWVLARDPESGRLVARRVLKTYRDVSDYLRILPIRSSDGTEQELRTTDGHPFWVKDKGWVLAGDLGIGTDGPSNLTAPWRP